MKTIINVTINYIESTNNIFIVSIQQVGLIGRRRPEWAELLNLSFKSESIIKWRSYSCLLSFVYQHRSPDNFNIQIIFICNKNHNKSKTEIIDETKQTTLVYNKVMEAYLNPHHTIKTLLLMQNDNISKRVSSTWLVRKYKDSETYYLYHTLPVHCS